VTDIRRIEELSSEDDLGMSLYHPIEEPEGFLGFKLFKMGVQVLLSDVLPLLEDMGVEVVDERPHEIKPAGSAPVWVYDFGLLHESQGELQTGEVRDIFQDAFARVWRGEVENDGYNRLVLRARLTWRQVSVLRAISKYLRQAGTTFSQSYMQDTLFQNHRVARLLVELFEARFDPTKRAQAEAETKRLKAEIEEALDAVASLDEDRILRNFLSVVLAAVRGRCTRSSSTPRAWRASTCAAARWRAAASAGPTAARTSAPKSWAS
jgi:glutamate dehydrogenase